MIAPYYDGTTATAYYNNRNGTEASSTQWTGEDYIQYFTDSLCNLNLDEIIKYRRIQPWEIEPPKDKYHGRKLKNIEQPFNRFLYINAYKSARGPPRGLLYYIL